MKKISNFKTADNSQTTIKQITGFANYYASANGDIYRRIINGDQIVMRKLNNRVQSNGYVMHVLKDDNGDWLSIQSARLILMAFQPDVDFTCFEPDHINGNSADNRLVNLEWVTHSENCKRASQRKTSKARINTAIYLITADNKVEYYRTRAAMIKHYNMSSATADRILNKHQSSALYNIKTAFYVTDFESQTDDVKDLCYDYEYNNRLF